MELNPLVSKAITTRICAPPEIDFSKCKKKVPQDQVQ